MSAGSGFPDKKLRCKWAGAAPEFIEYHDSEWGFPVADDQRLFEKLCLEGFQSGLSWRTILAKRENFRAAFHDFDFQRVARFTEKDVAHLLADPGIVRHRGKIESTINNARRARELRDEQGSLARYFWQWRPDERTRPRTITREVLMRLQENKAQQAQLAWRFLAWALRGARSELLDRVRVVFLAELEAKAPPLALSARERHLLRHGVLSRDQRFAIEQRVLREVVLPSMDALLPRRDLAANV